MLHNLEWWRIAVWIVLAVKDGVISEAIDRGIDPGLVGEYEVFGPSMREPGNLYVAVSFRCPRCLGEITQDEARWRSADPDGWSNPSHCSARLDTLLN